MADAVRIAAVDAPWGTIHAAARDDAVVAIELFTPPDAFVASVERRFGPARWQRGGGSHLVDRVATEIAEFLAGGRHAFDLSVDLSRSARWDQEVLAAVRSVGWGSVTSYGRVARMIGRPGAARAAGGAVGRNPVGLVVPCHRVIAGDGSLGGYGGDWYGTREQHLAIKRELLEREGIALPVRFAD